MASLLLSGLLLLFAAVNSESDWSSQCWRCRCMWSSGIKYADCSGTNMSRIPKNLSPLLRAIDFSNNPLYELEAHQFVAANLRDVHKMWLRNCSIEAVHETAFEGLALLIELDLSKNSIEKLHRNVFRATVKLRVLNVGYNRIKTLEDGLFSNLTHLQKVYLNNNEIVTVNPEAFVMLPMLQHVDFGNNRISRIERDFIANTSRLNSLTIAGNPWICDCHLQDFRNKTIRYNLITAPTYCAEPPRLKDREWKEDVVFACMPQIVDPLPNTKFEVSSSTFTMTCQVLGEPQPDVDWVYNNRIIDPKTTQKFNQARGKMGLFTWNNITITGVTYRDRGDYRCIAKNPAGVDERNVTLVISNDCEDCGLAHSAASMGSSLPLIIGLVIGAIILVIVIVLLACCLCKRSLRSYENKRHDLGQSTEYIGLDGRPEMEKALITDVNPIVKPPRQCSVPPSVTSGATEVSEVNKTLLDGDSIFAGDDESRSYDFDPRVPPKFQSHLDIDFRSDHPYPPDLLSFPHRIVQVSPAGSSASTVADTTRLPMHQPSPMTSPLYDTVNAYRTLPYSRSQSPFISAHGVPVRTPRPGAYVTIPRRPRQSWSSEPPSMSDVIGEPLYDNLGLRTSALGNSKAEDIDKASTPKGKPHQFTPTQDTIAEQDGLATLPRQRQGWSRPNGVVGSEQTNNRRDSTHSLPTPKLTKIPPQPPPKPKKRISTGPLFEDEGEDGTEV